MFRLKAVLEGPGLGCDAAETCVSPVIDGLCRCPWQPMRRRPKQLAPQRRWSGVVLSTTAVVREP